MKVIKGILIAFSTYSRLPVGAFSWKEEDTKYALIFFPWVGLLIGAVLAGWHFLCQKAELGFGCELLFMVGLPILITGGIHVDGFMDTMDAVHSYKSPEEKRKILADPHIGAFAVIMLAAYGLFYTGAWSEVMERNGLPAAYGIFFFARSLSGLSAVLFPKAKEEGMLHSFLQGTATKVTVICLLLQAVLCICYWLLLSPLLSLTGAAALAVMGGYFFFAQKQFGGVSGDTSGFFVLIQELVMVMVIALVS